ncbi:MAG TPA: sigma-54 dependent transcriptional regulator [Candidatus Binatia bacterium]|nr:sigma-54 dependent transcriptional regulator [Candidatus Binatia bacterium]
MNERNPIVFVIDDDSSIRDSLSDLIGSAGLKVQTFASAQEFLASSRRDAASCLVLDVNLPGLSGLDLQQELAELGVQIPIIFITGHGDIPMTVRAMKAGAMEFLTKPFRDEDLLNALEQAINRGRQLEQLRHRPAGEQKYSEDGLRSEISFSEIVGQSASLRGVLEEVETVAPTDSTVLICGETGTGKELIARAIHNLSPRSANAFVKLNCAAIPTGLLESELFGHERGAFTGAIAQRIGRFELASRGTIFLDEIGDIPLELQPKLLRVLQEREFERLGNARTLHTDARLIAATNANLAERVNEKRFRSDLYYRLNVFPVVIPPLRKRRDDIPLLVRHFVQKYGRRMGKQIDTIPAAAMDALSEYQWPGNVRELENVIERAVILFDGGTFSIDESWLKRELPQASGQAGSFVGTLLSKEKETIEDALAVSRGIIAGPVGAAAKLGIPRQTLESKIKRLGIDAHRFRTTN